MQIGRCVECKSLDAAGFVFGKCKERPQSLAVDAQRNSKTTLFLLVNIALEFLNRVWLRDVEDLNIVAREAVETDLLAAAG